MKKQNRAEIATWKQRVILTCLLITVILSPSFAQVSVTATAGTTGPTNYLTLNAAFAAINAGIHQGVINISITAGTTETTPPTPLLQSGGTSSYSSILIKPSGGNWTIGGAATPTAGRGIIELDGADNVTIDGDDPGTTGTRNLTFQNNTSTLTNVSVVRFASVSVSDGATFNTLRNCVIIGSRTAAGSSTTNYGIYSGTPGTAAASTSGQSDNNDNLTIENDSVARCYWGIYCAGTTTNFMDNLIVRNNIVGSPVAANAVANRGIYIQNTQAVTTPGATVAIVEGNDVQLTASTGGAGNCMAMEIANGNAGALIRNNNVHDVKNPSLAVGAYGITVSGSTQNASVTVYNNFVRDISNVSFGQVLGNSGAVYGIALTAGAANLRVYYNTVNLNTANTPNASNIESTCAFAVTTAAAGVTNLDVRNNIFSNMQTAPLAGDKRYAIYLAGTISAIGTINNNDYYSSGGGLGVFILGNFNGVDKTTLTAWQASTGQDGSSGSFNPNFTSSIDLHIPAVSSQLESGGVVIAGISTDYDGQVRPGPAGSVNGGGTLPDIGADEFDGIPADLTPPTISYTILGPTCNTTDRTVTATISDASGIPVSGSFQPRIYYRKNVGSYFSSQGVLTSGTATNGTWTFTIVVADMGGVTIGDQVFYYVIAQDIAGTPNITSNPPGVVASNVNTVSSPPPSPNSYFVQGALSGTFNVGVSQTYTTLTAAVNAYNGSCLTGPVTFILTDATYPSETFPITITSNSYVNSTNTLTIQPNTGVAVIISGTSPSSIIKFNGADYVTIDGLNTGGSSLSFSNSHTSVSSGVIWIGSASISDGATNNAIRNCNISGEGSTTTLAGISIGSGTTLGNEAESPNSNLTIQGCVFKKLKNGIYANGNAVSLDANWLFTQNTFGSTVTTDKLSGNGILLFNAQNFTVSSNIINGLISATFSTASGVGVFGNISGGNIYNNKISDVKNTNTGAAQGANGMQLSTTTTTSNISVYNNFIWDIASFGSSGVSATANGWGILISGGGGYNIYFNTVYLSTDQTFASSITAALNITNGLTTANSVNLRNNIFANTQTVGTNRYTVLCGAAATVFADINYNDYYVTGPNLGRIGGSDRVNLAAWQNGTGKDANSLSVNPSFVSTTDLHLVTSASTLDNSGVSIAGITTDIDGDTRPATPDMGADEFTFTTNNCTGTPTPGNIPPSVTLCPASPVTLTITGYTIGVLGITFQWEESDDNGATDPWANAVGGSGATTFSYTTPGLMADIYYRCKVTCSFSGLFAYTNACAISVTPFTLPEDFSSATFPPGCWTRNDASFILRANASAYGIGAGSAKFDFYNGPYQTNLDLTTPVFTPFPSGYYLYFDHAYATYSGEVDSLVILYSTNGGSSYNTLIVYQGGSSGPLNTGGNVGNLTQFTPTAAQWASKLVALPVGTNRIIFRGRNNFGNNLYIDNINFLLPAPCDAPVSPSVSNVTATSADISWTCTGCTGTYQLDYGTNGHTAGTGTLISSVTSPYTLSPPLVPNTAYTVYVRQNCGVYGFSSWSSAVNFTTLCAPPQPDVSSNSPVCSGFTLTFSGNNLASGQSSGNTYSWSGPSFSSIQQNPSISSATTANSGVYTLTVTNQYGCTASTTISVDVNPNPVLSIAAQTNVPCNGELDGEVDIDASNGAPDYLFDLNGSNTLDGIYTNLGAGTYIANVIDDNGCEATPLTVTITEPDVLTVSSGSNSPVCTGSALNLTSTPAGGTTSYSYAWTGPNAPVPAVQNPTISSATTADAGQYDLTITDAHGCTATSSASVIVNASPTATISNFGNSNICLSQPATVTLAFTDTGPWNYTVSDGTQNVSGSTSTSPVNINITPTTAGTHNYTVTAVGNTACPTGGTSTGTATVFVSTAPPTNTTGTPTGPTEACNGTVSLMTVNTVNGQNIRYSWNTGSNSSVVLFSNNIGGPFSPGPFQTTINQVYAQFGALAGSSGYNICVQGTNGCGSTNNKCDWIRGVVSVPGTITPPSGIVACPNDVKNYSCGASGGATVYNWTLGGSATPITSGQGTTNVSVTFPPSFTSAQLCVTAALSCGGSSTSAPRCMTISKNPAVPGAFTAGPSSVCPGATGVVYTVPAVTGAAGYSWTTPAGTTITSGQNTTSITVNFPNPYTGAPPVCVSATSACGSSAARCKAVGSNLPGQPGSVAGPTTNVCNSTVQYSISNVANATSYTWTNPAGTTITSGQTTTTILLSVSPSFVSGQLTVVANTNACTPGTSIPRTITINGKPNVPGTITGNPVVWCTGGFVNFSVTPVSPLPTYNWTVSNGTITAGQGSNNIDVTWGATAAGTVNVNASNGCGTSSLRSQSFSAGCREEGDQLPVTGNQLSVYPNPAHGKVTVSIDAAESTDFTLQLTDVSGRVVLSENFAGITGMNMYDLDLTGLSKGVYMLEVKSAGDNRKKKVAVE